jgi:hypothetical protein
MICRPFCKKPDNSTVPAGRPTGVRRTLFPPTTPLESNSCTMRACKVLRITSLRKNRGRGSHYVNHPTLSKPTPKFAARPSIGTSVLASLALLSGTDMPLLLAIRCFNITCTRELRAKGFGPVAAPKDD